MADTTALKNRIRAAIKANDNQEITGPVLQQTLLDIVDELSDRIIDEYALIGIAVPTTVPPSNLTEYSRVFYLTAQNGVYTNLGGIEVSNEIAIIKYNGTSWVKEQVMFTDDGVFDISAYHATGGELATYADLTAALDSNNGGGVPQSLQKGGMSVKFVRSSAQSSDNKYVQYRLMEDTWSIDTDKWALCSEDVLINNPEWVKVVTDSEGRVLYGVKTDGKFYFGDGCPQQVKDYIEEKIAELSLDEYEDIVAFLNNLEKGDKTLQTLLNEKVDKEEGKSLIDNEYASTKFSIDNPEFLEVTTDSEDKVLYGVKTDGKFYFGDGCPQQVKDYIEEKIAELSLDEYEDIVAFLNNLEKGDKTLQTLLNEKVDKEEGKSLIDNEYASTKFSIDNPEFLEVTTDSEDKVLEGIQHDGTKVIGGDIKVLGNMEVSGVSYKVIESPEYLAAWVDAEDKVIFGLKADGKTYVGDADFLNDIKDNQDAIAEIKTTLATIGVKVNSLDIDALSSITATENPEYIEAKTDSEGKILAGRTPDGAAFEKVGFSAPKVSIDGYTIKNIEDPEGRIEILTDSDNKIISYKDSEGVKHEEVGIKTKELFTDNLKLSDSGMTEFQQALKDAGFRPGGYGDFSDKAEMYIPEPRLAHLNIITDFNLTTLTKTSDVPVILEFYDGSGNYFKKYGILNGQGRSSLYYVKKGLGLDFFNENPTDENFDEDNVFSMKFGNWVSQDSFHIKSYYTDWPKCTTPVVYKLTDEILRTRGILEDRPYKKYYVGEYTDSASANTQDDLSHNMETGARCVPDGFPVIVYQNGQFWGVNSWQLKKHRDNYMLSKKKNTHIHLDGEFSTNGWPNDLFWLYNGTINWEHFCSGVRGIEIRNPKNLYCIDGKKYDADTHNAEIITTATAEEWIAAGQIVPTGKTIDDTLAGYLRTTGKVRENIEALTTYIPYINTLISGGASNSEIKAAISDRFDVNSFIDYILVGNVTGNNDAWDNNGQIITWGKFDDSANLHWSVNVYDCDMTFGGLSDGTQATAPNNYKLGYDQEHFPLYTLFWIYYYDELKARYRELRDKGIFEANHITQLFRDWISRVGYDNYTKEYKKWNQSPCFRDGSKTYTLNPTTGGFYGSIERIYLWIKKRIEYMDNPTYFDYSQN